MKPKKSFVRSHISSKYRVQQKSTRPLFILFCKLYQFSAFNCFQKCSGFLPDSPISLIVGEVVWFFKLDFRIFGILSFWSFLGSQNWKMHFWNFFCFRGLKMDKNLKTPAFVKFTNFVELYLANDRYFFNSVKSSWKNTSLIYRIT